jgi:polar amino acid transport system substrate-binding protein
MVVIIYLFKMLPSISISRCRQVLSLVAFLVTCLISFLMSVAPACAAPQDSSPITSITVGGDRDYPPYEFLDKDGQPSGYNVELTRAIANVMGMKVKFRLGGWSEMREALQSGKIDALQGMSYSEERAAEVDFSLPHAVVNHAVFARRDSPNINSMAEQNILISTTPKGPTNLWVTSPRSN